MKKTCTSEISLLSAKHHGVTSHKNIILTHIAMRTLISYKLVNVKGFPIFCLLYLECCKFYWKRVLGLKCLYFLYELCSWQFSLLKAFSGSRSRWDAYTPPFNLSISHHHHHHLQGSRLLARSVLKNKAIFPFVFLAPLRTMNNSVFTWTGYQELCYKPEGRGFDSR
jgi:hypothetical protein